MPVTVCLAPSNLSMNWTEEKIRKQAAVYGFTAAFCFAPEKQDGAPDGCRTLILLVKAYQPGGQLVDRFYLAGNEAYHQAQAFVRLLSLDMEAWLLSNLRLKPICTRQPQFGRGLNTLNYLPEIGSRFSLEMIGISEKVETIVNADWNLKCASCKKCMLSCPTGAIREDGFVRERCLRNYMLSGKAVPEEYRSYYGIANGAMGVIGCDVCQRVCPYNAQIEKKRSQADEFSLSDLLTCNSETLDRFGRLYGRNYAIRNRVIAQSLLAAGNSGDSTLLTYITPLKESQSAAVAEHAAWAEQRLSK